MVLGSNRIFRKSAIDGSVTVYLGTRDFVDYFTHCDPVEGVVLLNPMAVENKNIYVGIVAIFRYGREEDEILGMSFCRELYITHKQIYPRVPEPTLTPGDNTTQLGLAGGWLHEKLLKKLGAEALPFRFILPTATPVSVVMLQGMDSTDTCGVRYCVRCYASSTPEKPSIRWTIASKDEPRRWIGLNIERSYGFSKIETWKLSPLLETVLHNIMCGNFILRSTGIQSYAETHAWL
ncbi:phosrestin-1-like [Tachypleus tridentatus]|uniref:phosrestin-1-like n=1 Tax=Tachypleus tridentatus TaxID=6853 RepID=UPI003FD4296B